MLIVATRNQSRAVGISHFPTRLFENPSLSEIFTNVQPLLRETHRHYENLARKSRRCWLVLALIAANGSSTLGQDLPSPVTLEPPKPQGASITQNTDSSLVGVAIEMPVRNTAEHAFLDVSDGQPPPAGWWEQLTGESITDLPNYVAFGLDRVLLDTLENSPRIKVVSNQASVALERIVQQDAAFDARVLFDSRVNRNNDPVGNTLTTGGPPRLIDENLTGTSGLQRTTRRGGQIDISQQFGLATSNSLFFEPANQGNSRLSLSLNQPLLGRSGQFYNERLLAQARVDSRVTWQQMRGEVETRLAEVTAAYWRLYELRCHYLQMVDLLHRGESIEAFLSGRGQFDTGPLERVKVRARIARRIDRQLRIGADIKSQQATLAQLVGSETLTSAMTSMEMIPTATPSGAALDISLQAAVKTGIENRPEIKSATAQLEAAALSIRVTRAELQPQLSAVFETYLAGLNANNDILSSLTNQFTQGGPGLAAGLQYELPYGRRAAKARHREANHRYRSRAEELREIVQQVQAEIAIALVRVQTAQASLDTTRRLLDAATEEEQILVNRWETLASDGGSVGVILETVLDAQTRRTDAERGIVSAQVEQAVAMVQLQQAMGTLLIHNGASPVRDRGSNQIYFSHSQQLEHDAIELNQAVDVRDETTPTRPAADTFPADPFSADPFSTDHAQSITRLRHPRHGSDLDRDGGPRDPMDLAGQRPGRQRLADSAGDQLAKQSVTVENSPQRSTTDPDLEVNELIEADWLEQAMFGDVPEPNKSLRR